MKKFATPLAIKGSKEELLVLVDKLKELGYSPFTITNDWEDRELLVTNHAGSSLHFTNLSDTNSHRNSYKRITVSASNPELVLALAAMTEGDIPIVGEYVTPKDYLNLKKVGLIDKDNHIIVDAGAWKMTFDFYRKATVQEIMDHFAPAKLNKEILLELRSGKNNHKKLVGYRLIKPEYAEAACKIEGYKSFGEIIKNGKPILFSGGVKPERRKEGFERLRKAGVLDLWFEPVYEEEKKFIEIEFGKTSKDRKKLQVEIISNGGVLASSAVAEGAHFTKSELQRVLNTFEADGVKFKPTFFNVGCYGQYENVSREDIQKVIDVL